MRVLPDKLRDKLKEPIGQLVDEEKLLKILKHEKHVVSVGDQVTYTLLKHGISPIFCVVDFKVKRNKIPSDFNELIRSFGKKTVKIHLHNTNPSIYIFDNILISKTGYTNPAGRCVVMLVEKNNTYNGIVILGQKNVSARSKIATDLIKADPLKKPEEKTYEPIEFDFEIQ